MARKICNHPVFHTLRAKLTALKIAVCPTCLLRLHIFEIAETQAGLERRGGIFASRAAADDALASSSEIVCHRVLVRRWRLAKIDLHRDLCQLEALRDETAGTTPWKLQLAKAFELWKEVENECSRMPGYKYCEKSAIVDREGSFVEPEVDVKDKLNKSMRHDHHAEPANSHPYRDSRWCSRRGRRSRDRQVAVEVPGTAFDQRGAAGAFTHHRK